MWVNAQNVALIFFFFQSEMLLSCFMYLFFYLFKLLLSFITSVSFFLLQDSQHVTSGYNGSKEHLASTCQILAYAKFIVKQYWQKAINFSFPIIWNAVLSFMCVMYHVPDSWYLDMCSQTWSLIFPWNSFSQNAAMFLVTSLQPSRYHRSREYSFDELFEGVSLGGERERESMFIVFALFPCKTFPSETRLANSQLRGNGSLHKQTLQLVVLHFNPFLDFLRHI